MLTYVGFTVVRREGLIVKIKIATFFIVFSLTLSNTGCTIQTLSDLEITSIDKVHRSELREIIGDDVNFPLVEYWANNDDFLKLEFSIKENLVDYIRKTTFFTMHVNASFCDAPNDVVFLGLSDVYVKGKSAYMIYFSDVLPDMFPDVPEKDTFKLDDDGMFVYDIVLFTEWSKERRLPKAFRKNKEQLFYLQYDLKENPLDICLSIGGGNEMLGYHSNEIRISKIQIQEAIFKEN